MTRRRGAYLVGDGFTGNCSGSRAHVAYLPSLQDTIPHYRLHVLLSRSPPRLPVLPQTFLMRYVRVKRLPQFYSTTTQLATLTMPPTQGKHSHVGQRQARVAACLKQGQ